MFKYGMKRDFNKWLASRWGRGAGEDPHRAARVEHGRTPKRAPIKYGQSRLDISDEMDLEADARATRPTARRTSCLSRDRGIDAVMKANNLDAIFSGPKRRAIAASAGYPMIVVPFGMVPNAPAPPFPAGLRRQAAPYGVGFTGMACSEPRLIELAYAFEQASKRRMPPPSPP